MTPTDVAQSPFPEELPRLLKQRGMSLRALAWEVGAFDHGYLSRMIHRKAAVNVRHAEAIADHLGLRPDYFPEVREAAVLAAVRAQPKLRDAIYFEHINKESSTRRRRLPPG
jgi:transcriptional regulator with XRE-family HTH domain